MFEVNVSEPLDPEIRRKGGKCKPRDVNVWVFAGSEWCGYFAATIQIKRS